MYDASHRLSVAPMMELTDRHFRYLIRRLTRHTVLYTEMLTTGAVLNGDKEYLLGKDPGDNPVVLQLGGSDPAQMAEAAAIGEQWGYDAINMNVGCPSDRVKSGRFGACLMAEPGLVYEALRSFVEVVASKGCQHFIVHARKAWLDGLSPRENRTIPPLRYEYVYRLKREFPSLQIDINGGIDTLADTKSHLQHVDGVMIGREAYYNPSCLLLADEIVYGQTNPHRLRAVASTESRIETNIAPSYDTNAETIDVLAAGARDYAQYMQNQYDGGVRINAMSRHVVALYQGVPGARLWRRHLSENASNATNAIELVDRALEYVLDAPAPRAEPRYAT